MILKIGQIARVIQHGWPEQAKELEDDIKVYFPYRFVVTYCQWNHLYAQQDCGSNRSVTWIFLAKLHDNHMGIAKTRLLA